MTGVLRLKNLPVLLLLGALTGCATTAATDPSHDWPMVPSTQVAKPAPKAEVQAADAQGITPAPEVTAADLVSPVMPPDANPLSELPDVFDRIRLGYALPDVTDKAVSSTVKFFANKPEFLDRTFERAERYLYYVTRELEARHMPLELAMLPVIESAYNPYAFSRARAAGIWQFIAPTATRHQVRVNWWQDGRRDIVDSTRAALDYLSELHQMFGGDWLLAVAAYNCGELAVQRAINRNRALHKPTDFWHLKLPKETRGYVPSLLAMARIVANPGDYGLEFTPIANKPFFAQVEVGGQVDLRVAAAILGISEDDLHALNPAFNRWATDPDGPYHLLVPAEAAVAFAQTFATLSKEQRMPLEHYLIQQDESIEQLAAKREFPTSTIRALNGLAASDWQPGSEILLPASQFAPLRAGLIIEGELPARGRHGRAYVVHRGETLASIAKRTGVPIKELARLNGLGTRARLHAGARLVVAVQEREKLHPHRHGKKATVEPSPAEPRKLNYVVKGGDTLHRIGRKFSVSVEQLKQWNQLSGSDLQKGQKLVLYTGREQDYGG